ADSCISKPKINEAGPLVPFTNVSGPRRNTRLGTTSLNESPLNVTLLPGAVQPLSSPPHVRGAGPTPRRPRVSGFARRRRPGQPGRRKARDRTGAPNEPLIVPE